MGDALLETLIDLGLTDDWQHMIDRTTVHGHSQSAGAKGGLSGGSWSITRQFYDKNRRPRKRSWKPSWLHPDGWRTSKIDFWDPSNLGGEVGQELLRVMWASLSNATPNPPASLGQRGSDNKAFRVDGLTRLMRASWTLRCVDNPKVAVNYRCKWYLEKLPR